LRIQFSLVSHLFASGFTETLSIITIFGLISESSQDIVDASSSKSLKIELKTNGDLEETKKRLLKACLIVAILKKLTQLGFVSPTIIITFFKEKYNIKLSPGTVYPVFRRMEKDGDIERLPKKTNRLFVLTKKGDRKVIYFHSNLDRFYDILEDLL
jgi:hypothetical protein